MDATVSQGNGSSSKSLIDLDDDHSLPQTERNSQTNPEKELDFDRTTTDDFEHINAENPSYATSSSPGMSNLENFMTELSHGPNRANVDKFASINDFMKNERQSQEHHQIDKDFIEEFDSGDIQNKEVSKTVCQDVKKNLQEDNEKFISSEDLRDDFKDEKRTVSAIEQAQCAHLDEKQTSDNQATGEFEQLPLQEPEIMAENRRTDATKPVPSDEVVSKDMQMITAEEIFCRYGLDAWFKPDRLHPKVESLIYWRDAKKTGVLFGVGLTILLAISCYSVISVFAYVSLLTLIGTSSFRIYKDILGAIQKTSDGHPFKQYLEQDVKLSQEKVQNMINVGVAHLNATVLELRRLFLVENLIDSLKFGFILWTCTYIGSWFNGMTIVILAFVALFTLPKVYENNKQSIDTYIDLVRSKFLEITDKVKTAIPIGKKQESDKEK